MVVQSNAQLGRVHEYVAPLLFGLFQRLPGLVFLRDHVREDQAENGKATQHDQPNVDFMLGHIEQQQPPEGSVIKNKEIQDGINDPG